MKVVVIGAGVVGVATAWYLTKDGHEVTIVERRSAPAEETSFGNAGGVCPGFAGPWAAPGMPFKALKWMFQKHPPLKFRPKLDPQQWSWLFQFILNCTSARFADNKARMQRMAHYSKACLVALREETGIAYDHASKGVLQTFCCDEEMEAGTRASKVLTSLGIEHVLADAAGVAAIEPALNIAGAGVVGGLHLPGDETGDCRLFTQELAKLVAQKGGRFLFDTEVTGFATSGDTIDGVVTKEGLVAADAVVVAGGPFIVPLMKSIGISLPIYPVKGYSLTCDITDEAKAPASSIVDEHSKVMVSRLGSRVRAAGVAELAGFDPRLPKSAVEGVRERVALLYPGAGDYARAEFWCGFRPMMPDGPSRVGKTRFANLFLNSGHGSNGWTQACGTGKVVTDIIAGREPDIAV